MRSPRRAIDVYLDEVMRHARLAPAEARRVRSELCDHLLELLGRFDEPARRGRADGPAPETSFTPRATRTPQEELTIMHNEFGDPAALGDSIGRSKGRLRTYLKKRGRRLAVAAAAAVAAVLVVRATVAEAYAVTGDCVSPALPEGSHCLVYKLASSYAPRDVIVFEPVGHPERRYLGVVAEVLEGGDLRVTRNNLPPFTVRRSAVVGRVVVNTR